MEESVHEDTAALTPVKASAIRKYGQLTNLFRVIEIYILLITLSRISSPILPAVISVMKSSSEYFKCFSIIISSPRFMFFTSNAIIITLFATLKDSSENNSIDHVYEEFIQNGDYKMGEEKQSTSTTCDEKTIMVDTSPIDLNLGLKRYMKSKSDSETYVMGHPILLRTVTESCQRSKSNDSGEKDDLLVEDKLSNEKFKRAVEAFIAKQKKFLREED